MAEIPYLRDFVVLFGSALFVIALSHRLRIPTIVGFLITGAMIGPFGLGFIKDSVHVEVFAEFGVVFLLFVIGLELSIDQIKRLQRIILLGGNLQAIITTILVTIVCYFMGFPLSQSFYFGFLIFLSSTAIVLKYYSDHAEITAPYGQISMGILLYQDILIVPLLLTVPVLAGTASASNSELLIRFGGGLAAVALVFVIARFFIPHLLRLIVDTGIRELLVIGALFSCLGAAFLTESLGFSMALGAFLAGILISESDYRHQLIAEMSSIRDIFNSIFFISIGMLLNLKFACENAILIVSLLTGIVILKAAVLLLSTLSLSYPLRICILTSLGLSQIGEFSFVLIRSGHSHGLLNGDLYQLAIASTVLTMLLTPLLIRLGPKCADYVEKISMLVGFIKSVEPKQKLETPSKHVIVFGFGLNGRHLSRVLKAANCSYVVVDLNGHKVRQAKLAGEPILYGDATRHEILEKSGIKTASIAVYAISDPNALRRSVRLARHLNPELYIVVRSWQLFEIDELQKLGANDVIAQEFEASIEIVTIVLSRLHLPRNIIRAESKLLRADGYQMLRSPTPAMGISEKVVQALASGTTETFLLSTEHNAVGKTLRSLGLRNETGATVIAVGRRDQSIPNPSANLELEADDVLVLVGSHTEIESAFVFLERSTVKGSETL